MTDETLRQLLASVHERLGASSTVDPDTRELLKTVMRDIEAALTNEAAGTAAQPGAMSLSSTPLSIDARVAASQPPLEALAVRFEAEHPQLAQSLRQLGELLSQAGI